MVAGARGSSVRACLLALVIAVALSGCLTSAGHHGGDHARTAPPPDDDDAAAPPGPYAHLVPGVERLTEPALAEGGAIGVVYDLADRQPVADAQVIAQCQFFDFPFPLDVRLGVTDELGRFQFPATAFFATCDEVIYDVLLPGYVLETPLRSGALGPDAQYFVKLGMDRA
jgi:hypothetical protein